MKSTLSEALSAFLSESLGKRECFGVLAPQETCVRAFWNALSVSFVGDSAGILLFVALGEYRRRAFKQALSAQKLTDCPQIQITTPQILEHLLAVDETRCLDMLSQCRRILVWLHPDDIRDSMLDYWFEIVCRIPHPNIGYFHVPSQVVPLLERIHPQIRWFGDTSKKNVCLPVVHFLEKENEPSEMLDASFWKTCRNRRTLVSCMHQNTALLCEEAAHHAHLPTSHTQNRENAPESIVFTLDARAVFYVHRANWDHIAFVDAPFADGVCDEIGEICEKPRAVSLLVSSHFSLINTLAGYAQSATSCSHRESVTCMAYRLFSRLAAKPVMPADLQTSEENALMAYWRERGWVRGSSQYVLTAAGKNLFAGIPHFSSLGALHGHHHETMGEHINHDVLGLIDTDWLNLLRTSAFYWGGQQLQCTFYNHLEHHALFKGSCGAGGCWLDAVPYVCSFERAQAMHDVICGNCNVEGMVVTDVPTMKLSQIRSHFNDIHAKCWIEVTPGAAQWWTFAGAHHNALMASLLCILSPKLVISYGNLSLILRWCVSGAWRPEPVMRRLKELSQQLCHFSMSDIENANKTALFNAWVVMHPWQSLFILLPQPILESQFEQDYMAWARVVQMPDFIEVSKLHALDAECLPPILQSNASETIVSPKKAGVQPQFTGQVSPSKPIVKSEPPLTIEQGDGSIMHTRLPWSYIADARALGQAINLMLSEPFIGLDVETTLFDQRLCLIQIGCAAQTFIIDPLCVDFSPLAQVFENPNLIKVIHNSSFECKVLGKYGIQINNIVDTLKVSRKRYGMKYPGGHSLRAVCLREFGFDMDKTNQTSRWDKRPLSAEQLEYAALDAEILVHLYRHFEC